MKHSFIALCILATTFTASLIACSKKGWLPTDETIVTPVRIIPTAKSDTPYGKSNAVPTAITPVKKRQEEIVMIPAAKGDTPYGKKHSSLYFNLDDEPTDIKIIPMAKSDTPYGK